MSNGPEQHLQEWFVMWLRSRGILHCASAGGMRTSYRTARRMKMAGYRAGFPDMFIPVPRGRFHGLFIELKVQDYPSPEQREWRDALLSQGYLALIVPATLNYRQAQEWLEKKTTEYLLLQAVKG